MKKKTILIGDKEFVIAELNMAQVDELVAFQANAENGDARKRVWRTILLSLNNAQKPPTRDNPLGSDAEPFSLEEIVPQLGFASFQALHGEVLALSGIRKQGESQPETETVRPISAISAVA